MICEGVCNPHRLDVQRLVPPMASRQVDHDDKRMTTILPVNDNVAQALRTLKHTTHRPTLGEWVCTVCGRKRD
jgi:hypothetical protein